MLARTGAALLALLAFAATPAAADSSSFGKVENTPILWEPANNVELTAEALRFTRQGSRARSQPLPLKPQHYYRIQTKMARGPGSTIHFSITYLDASQKPREWIPSWQLKRATHASWLPLSPTLQRYVQGFVLPLGATQPRLELHLDQAQGPHSRWDLTELRIENGSAAPSCKKLSPDRLLGGDFEGASHDGVPAYWAYERDRVELTDSETPCKHVLRVEPGNRVFITSSYLVPVSPGSAYQLSLKARGHGRIDLDVHSLSRDRPNPQRVGNTTQPLNTLQIASDKWTQLEQTWFAEAPNVSTAHVMVIVEAQTAVEIDAVELRACEALSSP